VLGRAAEIAAGCARGNFTAQERRKCGRVFWNRRAQFGMMRKADSVQGTLVDVTSGANLSVQVGSRKNSGGGCWRAFRICLGGRPGGALHVRQFAVQDLLGCPCEGLLGKKVSETQGSSPELVALYHDVVASTKAFSIGGIRSAGAAMESGKPCGPPPANFLTR